MSLYCCVIYTDIKKAMCRKWGTLLCNVWLSAELFADAELFLGDDGTVALDIVLDEIIEQATTLAYQRFKSACGGIIFVI